MTGEPLVSTQRWRIMITLGGGCARVVLILPATYDCIKLTKSTQTYIYWFQNNVNLLKYKYKTHTHTRNLSLTKKTGKKTTIFWVFLRMKVSLIRAFIRAAAHKWLILRLIFQKYFYGYLILHYLLSPMAYKAVSIVAEIGVAQWYSGFCRQLLTSYTLSIVLRNNNIWLFIL